jgi:hypothetical protein
MIFIKEQRGRITILRLCSLDMTNRLTRCAVNALTHVIAQIARERPDALIITGNEHFSRPELT